MLIYENDCIMQRPYLKGPGRPSMNILALDLGTKCGYALETTSGSIVSGTWNLTPSKFDSTGQRYVTFRQALLKKHTIWPISKVYYEEVRAHMAVDAAHVYGGMVAILQTFCLENGIEYQGVPVGTIKKHATGKGNAKKPAMVAAAIKLYPAINVVDDNHADALCILNWVGADFLR